MPVWKPIATLTVAACLASGPAWADAKGAIRVGITIVQGCEVDTTHVPAPNRPVHVDCSAGVPYRVTTSDHGDPSPRRPAIVPDEGAGIRIATLTL